MVQYISFYSTNIIRLIKSILFLLILFPAFALAQTSHTIMSYNLLNYPGNDTTGRNPYFRTTMASIVPDILVVQEMNSQIGVNGFLNNVLNVVSSGYAAGSFIDGPDTDNAIFFKTDAFTFITHNVISTALRNISEFILSENSSGDTIRIYSVHLKASEGSSNQQQRLAEVTALRNVTDALPVNSNFIVCGDFNIYSSNEPAYQKLKNQSAPGYFVDIYNLTGTWNNSGYAAYHTQSPRTRQFGGGANGGMDDRFDMILMSQAMIDTGKIYYVPGSYTAYGNDGNHYNDSINRPPNNAVSQSVANALHYATDHIPVLAEFIFKPQESSIFISTTVVQDGWNLVSFPGIHPNSMYKDTLYRFRDPSIGVFQFTSGIGYATTDTLNNGNGYWLYHNGARVYNWNGTVQSGILYPQLGYPAVQPINGGIGWNLIGVYDYEFATSELTTSPPGLINGQVYGYVPGFGYSISTTMQPGKAYWINLTTAGQIIYPPRK